MFVYLIKYFMSFVNIAPLYRQEAVDTKNDWTELNWIE